MEVVMARETSVNAYTLHISHQPYIEANLSCSRD
jgi:hypothetical protein